MIAHVGARAASKDTLQVHAHAHPTEPGPQASIYLARSKDTKQVDRTTTRAGISPVAARSLRPVALRSGSVSEASHHSEEPQLKTKSKQGSTLESEDESEDEDEPRSEVDHNPRLSKVTRRGGGKAQDSDDSDTSDSTNNRISHRGRGSRNELIADRYYDVVLDLLRAIKFGRE